MKQHIKYKPGVVQGLYPERVIPRPSVPDEMLAKVLKVFQQPLNFNRQALYSVIESIHEYDEVLENLDDDELDERISAMKSSLHLQGLKDSLVQETFALIREVSARQLNMRHFDVQLMGGWVMIKGQIAQMQTGEGKTLVATLPACTAALAGIPVHVITVNDYLVQRDAELMMPVYQKFGLTVGTITEDMELVDRQKAYACDITYCSNKQLTFDYLKDKQVLGRNGSSLQQQLKLQLDKIIAGQDIEADFNNKHHAEGSLHGAEGSLSSRLHLRGLCYAIVDEADSVLVDESRTPLILSRERKSLDQQKMYQQAFEIAGQLQESKDFVIEHRNRLIELTLNGLAHIEQKTQSLSGIWSAKKYTRELITQALSAKYLFIKDVHYLIKDDKVVIIDDFTGRVMADRSWEGGLHQLIETKEGCELSGQKETLARISYQTFFRRYLHLSGMTGTATEVSKELFSVYKLQVVNIPTHKQVQRKQFKSRFFSSQAEKWQAVFTRIQVIQNSGRPVLVGTRSVEASEELACLLDSSNLDYHLLNARQDSSEAEIVQSAGTRGCITIATNMAGRGTDIRLEQGVNELGGLHVIATECHESKRIDRQLSGRCARQGDNGSYEMYFSLDDEIVTKYTPSLARLTIKKFLSIHLPGTGILVSSLFFLAQTRAQMHQASIRAGLFKMDSKLDDLLAFSGKSE